MPTDPVSVACMAMLGFQSGIVASVLGLAAYVLASLDDDDWDDLSGA